MSSGIIILAAGNSSRLGQPKQLLEYNGMTLLSRIVSEASAIIEATIVVVTGNQHENIENSLPQKKLVTCYNPDWQEGMSSSIQAGLKQLLLVSPKAERCIISVCDQPFLTSEVFRGLIQLQKETGKGIVASSYSGTLGVPVLFTRQYFHALISLKSTEGARQFIKTFKEDVAALGFEDGSIDIDTLEDYNKLLGTETLQKES